MPSKRWSAMLRFLLALGLVAAILGCSGPEEKKMKFFEKGEALYEKGDFVRARLEFKNAIQIDPKFAMGYYKLGMAAVRIGNHREAFGSFMKAADIEPGLLEARIELGKMLLAGREFSKALEQADIVLKGRAGDEEATIVKASALMGMQKGDEALKMLDELRATGVARPEVYLLMGSGYADQGRMKEAEALLREGIEKNPQFAVLKVLLARIYMGEERLKEAVALMTEALKLEPKNHGHREILAGLYWKAGDKDKAVSVLREPMEAEPGDEGHVLRLARFLLNTRQRDAAKKELEEGIKRIPAAFDLRFALAELLTGSGKAGEAVAVLKDCIGLEKDQASPKALRAKAALAETLLITKDLDQAEKYTKEVLEKNPGSVESRFTLGRILLARKEPGRAVSEFRTVVNDRPEFVPGHLHLAEAHAMNNEMPLAIEALVKAANALPKSKEIRTALASLYMKQKDNAGAEAELKKVVELFPDDPGGIANLGDFYAAAGDGARAEAQFILLKKTFPDNPLGGLKLANLYLQAVAYDKSKAVYSELVGRFPDLWPAVNDLAFLKAEFPTGPDDLKEAEALAKKAHEAMPREGVAADTLGWISYKVGDYGQAEKLISFSLEKSPENPTVNYHLAMVMIKKGEKARAGELLKKALDSGRNFIGKEAAARALKEMS